MKPIITSIFDQIMDNSLKDSSFILSPPTPTTHTIQINPIIRTQAYGHENPKNKIKINKLLIKNTGIDIKDNIKLMANKVSINPESFDPIKKVININALGISICIISKLISQ
jgi:hypothetical protein